MTAGIATRSALACGNSPIRLVGGGRRRANATGRGPEREVLARSAGLLGRPRRRLRPRHRRPLGRGVAGQPDQCPPGAGAEAPTPAGRSHQHPAGWLMPSRGPGPRAASPGKPVSSGPTTATGKRSSLPTPARSGGRSELRPREPRSGPRPGVGGPARLRRGPDPRPAYRRHRRRGDRHPRPHRSDRVGHVRVAGPFPARRPPLRPAAPQRPTARVPVLGWAIPVVRFDRRRAPPLSAGPVAHVAAARPHPSPYCRRHRHRQDRRSGPDRRRGARDRQRPPARRAVPRRTWPTSGSASCPTSSTSTPSSSSRRPRPASSAAVRSTRPCSTSTPTSSSPPTSSRPTGAATSSSAPAPS